MDAELEAEFLRGIRNRVSSIANKAKNTASRFGRQGLNVARNTGRKIFGFGRGGGGGGGGSRFGGLGSSMNRFRPSALNLAKLHKKNKKSLKGNTGDKFAKRLSGHRISRAKRQKIAKNKAKMKKKQRRQASK